MTLGPKGYLRLPDTFRVVSSASGVNCSYLQPCLLTLTILDTRQWASMWNKSLAHKDKPLVQKKKMWDTEISWPLITSKQKLSVPMANADLLISERCCLRIHKFIHRSFFLQWIGAVGMFCSNLVENFLLALISHFFYSSCFVWSPGKQE